MFTEMQSNGQDPATAKPKDTMGEKNSSNVLISVTSLGTMKTSHAINIGPDPKPAHGGCTTNIPDSTRNLKPAVSNNGVPNGHFYELTNLSVQPKDALFSQTTGSVIGPVVKKPEGIQPQPSLTSRSSSGSQKPGESVVDDQMKPVHRPHPSHGHFPSSEQQLLSALQKERSASGECSEQTSEKKTIEQVFKERLVQDAKARRKEMVFAD